MSDNLALWQAVEKTPVEHTKAITGKSYSGTSPKPHYLVRKATETFGPCGIGWGFTVDERVEAGAMIDADHFEKMHIAKVTVWYEWGGKRGEVTHVGGTPFSGKRASGKPYTDEDAPKKSVTDALVKALSMIGFAGDIFMGRYDDSKYVNDLRDEAREAAKPEPSKDKPKQKEQRNSVIADTLIEAAKNAEDTAALKAWKEKQQDEIKALDEVNYKRVAAALTDIWNSLLKAENLRAG